jgi:hypothetical protein
MYLINLMPVQSRTWGLTIRQVNSLLRLKIIKTRIPSIFLESISVIRHGILRQQRQYIIWERQHH